MTKKKKQILVGIVIGAFARPVIKRAYRPFRSAVRNKLYVLAVDFIQDFDADRPS